MMTLDAVITKLSAHSDIDERGQDILAAAMTLRDSSGRDRKDALPLMTSTWQVNRRENIDGKWKDRPVATVASELQTAVCLAATQWEPKPAGEEAEQRDAPKHGEGSEQRGVAASMA